MKVDLAADRERPEVRSKCRSEMGARRSDLDEKRRDRRLTLWGKRFQGFPVGFADRLGTLKFGYIRPKPSIRAQLGISGGQLRGSSVDGGSRLSEGRQADAPCLPGAQCGRRLACRATRNHGGGALRDASLRTPHDARLAIFLFLCRRPRSARRKSRGCVLRRRREDASTLLGRA